MNNKYDFAAYKDAACIILDYREDFTTIAGIKMTINCDAWYTYICDVPTNSLRNLQTILTPTSIVYRLRDYMIAHDDNIFGFVEEEISKIHFFKK